MKDTYLKDGYFTTESRHIKGKGLNLNELIRKELRENGYPIRNCPDPCGEPDICDLINCGGGGGGNGLFDIANDNGDVIINSYNLTKQLTLFADGNGYNIEDVSNYILTSFGSIVSGGLYLIDDENFFAVSGNFGSHITRIEAYSNINLFGITSANKNVYLSTNFSSNDVDLVSNTGLNTASLLLRPTGITRLNASPTGELLIATKDVINSQVINGAVLQYNSTGTHSEYTPFPVPTTAVPDDGEYYFPAITSSFGSQVAEWQRNPRFITGVGGQTFGVGLNVDSFTLTSPKFSIVDRIAFYTAQVTVTTENTTILGEDVTADFTQAVLGAAGTPTNLHGEIVVTRAGTVIPHTITQISPTQIRITFQANGPSDSVLMRVRLTSHFL